MKPVEAANKEVAKALLNDLEDIQWTAINETFFDQIELVEKKYLKNNLLDVNTVSALFRDFFFLKIYQNGSTQVKISGMRDQRHTEVTITKA